MKPNVISEQDQQKNGSNRPVRKRFCKRNLYILLVIAFVILTILLFFTDLIYHKPDLNELLARAKLLEFPSSIQNLQVDIRPYIEKGRAVPNHGLLYVRFQAEPNDIEDFINNSPGIDKNRFRPISTAVNSNLNPTWWVINQSSLGRIYTLAEHEDSRGGTVIIDDDSSTVLIYMLFVANPQLLDMQIAIENIYDDTGEFLEDVLREVLDLFGD